jgi:hypothetical protein
VTGSLSAAEVAAILREALSRVRPLQVARGSRNWLQVAVGEVTVIAGDVELTFFADNACVDHLVRVARHGAAQGDFSGWMRTDGTNPVDLLTEQGRIELESLLQEAG